MQTQKTFRLFFITVIAVMSVFSLHAQRTDNGQVLLATTYSGNITTSNVTDRYTLSLPMAGNLSVNITAGTMPNQAANVRWLNANNQVISGSPTTTTGFSFPYNESHNVAAGTYHIEIVGRGGAGQTGTYNIRMDCIITENEDNNTITQANVIPHGYTMSGEINTTDTADIYRVVLGEPGRLRAVLTRGTLTYTVYIRWLNANGEQIRNDSSSSGTYDESYDFEAGVYYINVYSNYTGSYYLNPTFTPAGNFEIEPNNTSATAQVIASGQTIKGFISEQDGVDFYLYNLSQDGGVTVTLTRGTLVGWVYIKCYNSAGEEISNDYSTSGTYSKHMELAMGSYYIAITRATISLTGYLTGTYNVRYDFIPAGNNEVEPNNDVSQAQLLTNGQTVRGYIHDRDTIDYYRIVLASATSLTVNMTRGTLTGNVYVRWLNQDNVQLRQDNSTSGTYNQTLTLDAGSYFIGIIRNSSYGSYNLTLYTGTAPAVNITGVNVSPTSRTMQTGWSQAFTAMVNGTNTGSSQGVTWAIQSGTVTEGTAISTAGMLTIATEQVNTTLTIRATSTVDTSKYGSATVIVASSVFNPPRNLTATAGNGQVVLNWQTPLTGSSGTLTGFKVYRSTVNPPTTLHETITGGSTLSYTNTGLTNGTIYYYRVTATYSSSVGESQLGESNVAEAIPHLFSPPGAITVTPGCQQVALSWVAPTGTSTGTLSAYKIYRGTTSGFSPSETNLVHTITTNLTDRTWTHTGLTNGTNNYYIIRASYTQTNISGDSSNSPTSSVATPAHVWNVPQTLAATGSNGQIALTWATPLTGSCATLSAFKVYRGTTSGFTPGTGNIVHTTANATTLAWTDTPVTNGTNYYYIARASYTGTGHEGDSGNSNVNGPVKAYEHRPPATFIATAGVQQAVLTWTAPATGHGATVSGYKIYRAETSEYTSNTTNLVQTITSGSTLIWTNADLEGGVGYYFKIVTTYTDPAGDSTPLNATPYPITTNSAIFNPPQNLTGTSGNAQVLLNWEAPEAGSSGTRTGYNVYRNNQLITLGGGGTIYSQTFENATLSGIGWVQTSTSYTGIATGWGVNGSWGLWANVYSGLASRSFTTNTLDPITAGSKIIFDYRIINYTTTPSTATAFALGSNANIAVQISTTGASGSFSTLYTISSTNHTPSTNFANREITIPNTYAGQSINVRYLITWGGVANTDWIFCLDNFNITNTNTGPITASTYTDTSVTNGTQYTYHVTAIYNNLAGESNASNTVTVTPMVPFNTPQNLTATSAPSSIGNYQVILNWAAPAPGGPGTRSGYRVYRDGELYTTSNLSASVTTYTDMNVTNGTEYLYYVTAVYTSPAGESAGSNSVTSPISNPPLSMQASVTYNANGQGQVGLTWTQPATGSTGTRTGYKVYRGGTLLTTTALSASTTSYAVTSHPNGTTQTYWVTAVYSNNNESGATTATATMFNAPLGLSATTGYQTNGDSHVVLTWSAVANAPTLNTEEDSGVTIIVNAKQANNNSDDDGGTRAVSGYQVYRNGTIYTTSNINALTYTDQNVTNGTQYSYNVQAVYTNPDGNSPNSNTATATPQAPGWNSPLSFNATAGNAQVALNWTRPTAGSATHTGYKVYRGTSSNFTPTTPVSTITNVNTLTWNDTGLTNGNDYYYKIEATYTNPTGASIPLNATPYPVMPYVWNAPRNLTTTVGSGQVTLNWQEPTAGGATLSEYKVFRGTSQTNLTQIHEITSELTTTMIWINTNVPDGSYYYAVKASYSTPTPGGDSEYSNVVASGMVDEIDETMLPKFTSLDGNYPNPFNPETTIRFALAEAGNVSIEIFGLKGQLVRTLVNGAFGAGMHRVSWNGCDDSGRGVSSGVYFYRMRAGDYQGIKRMLLLK